MKKIRLNSVSVSGRLALLVALSIIALLVVGFGGWLGMTRVSESAAKLQDERLPAVKLLGDIRTSTATILQVSFEVLARERQANAQSRFLSTFNRLAMLNKGLDGAMASFDKLPLSPGEAEAWTKFREAMKPWQAKSEELSSIIKELSENDDSDKQVQLFGKYKQPLSSWGHLQGGVDVNLTTLLSQNRDEVEAAKERDEATRKLAMRIITISLGSAVLLLLVLAVFFVRSITVPLGQLRRTIVSVSDSSDFTVRADSTGRDELSQTAQAFNNLLENVQNSLKAVLENAEAITSSAQQVSSASQRTAVSSGEQSEAAAAMAAAIQEMTVSINHINDSMHVALTRVHEAGNSADTGVQVISSSNAEMDTIEKNVIDTSVAIDHLSGQTERISGILRVIKEVADQTNLLALNAAIEAARAGEQGRGFAVVADEVRKLAERTTQSTTEIAELVDAMQTAGRNAVGRMSSVTGQVSIGKRLSLTAVQHMNEIRGSARNVVDAINDISAALNEQSSTAQSIAQQVESVASLSETNNHTAAETATVSHDLDVYAAGLRRAVDQFKI